MEYTEPRQYQWKEHIRKRPGMYIGDLRASGVKQMLQYLFEEFLEYTSALPVFEMGFYPGNRVTMQVKGIGTNEIATRIAELNDTEKHHDQLGLWVVIALSQEISITVNDLPHAVVLVAKQGDYQLTASVSQTQENSVSMDFTLDTEIFKELKLEYEQVNVFLRQFAYLNPELKLISEDHTGTEDQRNVFYYPKGIFQQLDLYLSQIPYWYHGRFRLDIEASLNGYHYRIGLHAPDHWFESASSKTFAGNIETYWGGSLEEGIIRGVMLTMKALAKTEQKEIHVTKKLIKKQMSFMAAVAGRDFVYEGSTKRKLGVPLIKEDVSRIVFEHLMEYYQSNPKQAEAMLENFRIEEDTLNP